MPTPKTGEEHGAQRIDWAKLGWEALKGTAAGIAAVFSLFASYQSSRNSDALARLRLDADTRAQRSTLDLKVYELVEKALSAEGPTANGHAVAAAALINSLTVAPLRGQLLRALQFGFRDRNPDFAQELSSVLEFDAEADGVTPPLPAGTPGSVSRADGASEPFWSAVAPVLHAQSGLPGPLKGYRVDLFYCESTSKGVTDNRKKRADQAALRLKPAENAISFRVRLLPALVQARPEYQSYADEIRFDEEPQESQAAKFLAATLGIKNLHPVRSGRTQGYLSVFYCGN